jgi:pyridoxal phosphate enzyme (YggS family)
MVARRIEGMDIAVETIEHRIDDVRARLAAACGRAGRSPDDVRLVAVSKKIEPELIAAAAAAGVDCFGESRVQEAAQKIPLCPARLEWHLIGHLQRNKARLAAECFSMIHTVDSVRLLETLEMVCEETGIRMPICVEVNTSGEASKFGCAPDDVPALLERAAELYRVEVKGLMTIPPFRPDPEEARPYFAQLRDCRDRWRVKSGFALDMLSMGMTHDFEIAIEEGATCVRVGTGIFGDRERG